MLCFVQPAKPSPGAKSFTPAEQQAADEAAKKEAYQNREPWKNNGVWENKIVSFVVNGEAWHNRERMYGFLFNYQLGSAHTKCHVMGNSFADRILADSRVKEKLSESTWTTTALHHGLLYGEQGPLTHPRHAGHHQEKFISFFFCRNSMIVELCFLYSTFLLEPGSAGSEQTVFFKSNTG